MKREEPKYSGFHLVNEMLETAEIVRSYDLAPIHRLVENIKTKRFLLSGEGSSRIFPAKNVISSRLRYDYEQEIYTEGARQASEYALEDFTVFVASNSGKTSECVYLIRSLKKNKAAVGSIGITTNQDSPVAKESSEAYILKSGDEKAVAATKTVVEQALFYELLFRILNKREVPDFTALASDLGRAMQVDIAEEIYRPLVNAGTIYFAGRNDGVAEELSLKANEICRKKSDFLEGTYAVHGIEEVMGKDEVVVLIEPFAEEEEKFNEVLRKGVGLDVLAIASRKTMFPTLVIPEVNLLSPFVQLAAGWNLLVEAGISLGINLDKPERARKVGNEFTG